MTNRHSTSALEPRAYPRKRTRSRCESRPEPSAIFDGIDTAARRIRLVRPNLSELGNLFDAKHLSRVGSRDAIRPDDGSLSLMCCTSAEGQERRHRAGCQSPTASGHRPLYRSPAIRHSAGSSMPAAMILRRSPTTKGANPAVSPPARSVASTCISHGTPQR